MNDSVVMSERRNREDSCMIYKKEGRRKKGIEGKRRVTRCILFTMLKGDRRVP